MKWMIISLLLLAVTLLIADPAFAGGGDPDPPVSIRLTTKSSQGNPGDVITVSGSGADPGLSVFVTLAPQADSATGALATVEVTPAADGAFSAALDIPGDAADGIYAVRAEQFTTDGFVLHFYWNAFTIGSGGSGPLLPTTGMPTTPSLALATVILGLLLVMSLLARGVYAAATDK